MGRLKGVKPKAYRQLLERLNDAGYAVTIRKGGHVRVEAPRGVVFCSATMSDRRGSKNVRRDLRRYGVPDSLLD